MDNIYTGINAFVSANSYSKNDIVTFGGFFRYAKIAKAATVSLIEENWGGIATDDISGETKPNFFWKPSYGNRNNKAPNVKSIKFGDGFEQRIRDGINNNLLNIDYNFDQRDANEARAILHFLESRSGTDYFLFTPHAPFNVQKRFVCSKWQEGRSFIENYTISAGFQEVVV